MDTTTHINDHQPTSTSDHQPMRSSDHLICDWLLLAEHFPSRFSMPCQLCPENDAEFWNYDDERGEMFFCEACIDATYAPSSRLEVPSAEQRAATRAFIKRRRVVRFPELTHFLRDLHLPVDGDSAIRHPDNESVILWCGMSKEMRDLVITLEAEGEIIYVPVSRHAHASGDDVGGYGDRILLSDLDHPWHGQWAPTMLFPVPRATDA